MFIAVQALVEIHPCNEASASTFSQQGCKEVGGDSYALFRVLEP